MSRHHSNADRPRLPRKPTDLQALEIEILPLDLFPESIAIQQIRFAGPIPPPRLLGRYEQVLPGLADRLVTMAEGEAGHRRSLQSRRMRLAEAGWLSAFVISMTVIAGGLFLVHEGATTEGIGSVLAALSGLLVVYLTRGRRGRDETRTERATPE